MPFISKVRAGFPPAQKQSSPFKPVAFVRSCARLCAWETTMDDRQRAVQARVHGKVQGVGYRMWARHEATGLGLVGWVRNERDGTVTAWIAGADAAVSTMIERLRQGPSGASVSKVETEEFELRDAPIDFRIIV
jgi:acylphosphatase